MIDFVGKWRIFFAISLLMVLVGLVGFIVNGVKLDIQFEGGTEVVIEMNDDKFATADAEELAQELLGKEAKAFKLKTYNPEKTDDNIFLLKLQISRSQGVLTGEEQDKLLKALIDDERFSVKEGSTPSIRNIQPSIGEELRNKSILAVVISSILIILYIWVRFRAMSGLSAGVTAVIALLHDAAAMFAVYTVFKIPINEQFIAAVLTILGYSVNDTIIIYDRIRENLGTMKKSSLPELVNKSISQTLSRSINTSVTLIICVIVTYVFAAAYNITSIKEFTFPLIVGLISGTYSSLFIASQIWVMWSEHKAKKKAALKAAKA